MRVCVSGVDSEVAPYVDATPLDNWSVLFGQQANCLLKGPPPLIQMNMKNTSEITKELWRKCRRRFAFKQIFGRSDVNYNQAVFLLEQRSGISNPTLTKNERIDAALLVLGFVVETKKGSPNAAKIAKRLPKNFFKRRLHELGFDSYQHYLRSKHWQETRRLVRDRVIEQHGILRCERCPSTRDLETHHLTYKRLGAELLSDLVVVCNKCHEEIHRLHKI